MRMYVKGTTIKSLETRPSSHPIPRLIVWLWLQVMNYFSPSLYLVCFLTIWVTSTSNDKIYDVFVFELSHTSIWQVRCILWCTSLQTPGIHWTGFAKALWKKRPEYSKQSITHTYIFYIHTYLVYEYIYYCWRQFLLVCHSQCMYIRTPGYRFKVEVHASLNNLCRFYRSNIWLNLGWRPGCSIWSSVGIFYGI